MPWMEDSGCHYEYDETADIENKRLIYGQFSTAYLKKREPRAFATGARLLLLELAEALHGIKLTKWILERVPAEQRELRLMMRYSLLANERAAELVEKKLLKELKYWGYDEIDPKMMHLAQEAYAAIPDELGSYITNNSPMVKGFLADKRKAQ